MIKEEPLISIIVPIFRVEKYLRECLDSVERQSYKSLEVILVDDGSDDGCAQICDEYVRKDARFRVIHKKNGGLVSARKAAMPLTHGAYIGYVDSDDWIDANMYESLLSQLLSSGADMIVSPHYEEFPSYTRIESNHVEGGIYSRKVLKDKVYKKLLYDPSLGRWPIAANCWNKLFIRDLVFGRQMAVDEEITDGEDHAFVFPAMLDASSIYFTDDIFYHHRIRSDSVSLSLSPSIFTHFAHLYSFLHDTFTKSDYWDILKDQFPYHMRCFLFKYCNELLGIRLADDRNMAKAYIFPFDMIKKGEEIVLYGAGDVGDIYYRQIVTTGYCIIKAWIAKTAWLEYSSIVKSPEELAKYKHERIVIAALYSETADSIIKDLKDMGVNEERIVWRTPWINGAGVLCDT